MIFSESYFVSCSLNFRHLGLQLPVLFGFTNDGGSLYLGNIDCFFGQSFALLGELMDRVLLSFHNAFSLLANASLLLLDRVSKCFCMFDKLGISCLFYLDELDLLC